MSNLARKKVAPQIRDLAEKNVASKERSMYVIVGDNGRDQVVNLHYMLSKLTSRKPNILWCYKKELGFSSHTKKRGQEVKKKVRAGLHDTNVDDPFDMFQKTNDIRYCFYRDTEQILGKTFNMCVLQDFEALTPNILCRTIETVEGGGMVIVLLRSMSSLRQLFSVTMDMHKKYQEGEQTANVEARFNERFILSLARNTNCIVMDDEMNILPLSGATIANLAAPAESVDTSSGEDFAEISQLAANIKPVGDIVIGMSRTRDQANAVLQFTQTLNSASMATNSSIRRLVCLTSGRGRGKSAALGMAIGSAVAFGYSNIVVTAPSSDNVTTVFEFVKKTLELLGIKPHVDYVEITKAVTATTSSSIYSSQRGNRQQSTVPCQIVINKNNHRQTIQFYPANECVLGSAEILVIDEAAAIPLPLVKRLVSTGNHLTLMSSTVHGYEGTGRALSLKLISELKRNPSFVVSEIEMEMPIRYAQNDKVEKWLHSLLCLDSTEAPELGGKFVPPTECKLYMVNRDALFSHHRTTEKFLKNIVSLFVSSHYKNSPDDLMLMSDAPKHHVLVLLPPILPEHAGVPEVYVAVQIAIEGRIGGRADVLAKSGLRPNGDMIPWTLSQQFSDTDFGRLNGIRIVRIAVHPALARMGYGSQVLAQLSAICSIDRVERPITPASALEDDSAAPAESLTMEVLKPRKLKEPLFSEFTESIDSIIGSVDFIGTSFGLTTHLFNFWRKAQFFPLYVRQNVNDTTGEFTCMMIKANDTEWLAALHADFSLRFQRLLAGPFRQIDSELALAVVGTKIEADATGSEMHHFMTPYDVKRLRSYARGECDYHLITDLVPMIAHLLFSGKVQVTASLSFLAKRVLVGMGLQHKTIDDLHVEDPRITIPQILGIFKPTIDKISGQIEKKLETKIKNLYNQRKNKNLPEILTVPTPDGRIVIEKTSDRETCPTPSENNNMKKQKL